MSDCKCLPPCSPCKKNCPDDGEILPTEIIPAGDITPSSVIDPEDCNTNCCGKTCSDNKGINIQSTNPDCLKVDTSECGVIKLEPVCPPIVVAGDNITVDVEDCGQSDCSKKYIVNSTCKDEKVKVKACGEPDYLSNLITAGDGIKIERNCNDLKFSVKRDDDPNHCPEIPDIHINNASEIIDATASGHTINISDKGQKYAFGKIRLAEGGDIYINDIPNRQQKWYRVVNVGSGDNYTSVSADWEIVKMRNVERWPTLGCMRIKYKGLYYIGFDGTMEIGSGIHAFRAQLYSSTEAAGDVKTLLESRFSAPVGYPPNKMPGYPSSYLNDHSVVTNVSGGGEDPVSVQRTTINKFLVDDPIWQPEPDLEQSRGDPNYVGGSLGSYCSRFHVGGSTIMALDAGDWVYFGFKVSTEVSYHGNVMNPSDKTGKLAILCYNSTRSGGKNIGGEPGLSISLALITPFGVND